MGKTKKNASLVKRLKWKGKVEGVVSLCECVSLEVKNKNNYSLIKVRFNPYGYNKGYICEEVIIIEENKKPERIKFCVDIEE